MLNYARLVLERYKRYVEVMGNPKMIKGIVKMEMTASMYLKKEKGVFRKRE